jgi:spermidine dehydrogenase
MKQSDKKLGMDRTITRRDVIHGIGAIGAGLALPGCAQDDADELVVNPGYYPPELMGLRGNHEGTFEIAHALAREGRTDWGPVTEPDSGVYDLVVVGGGLSGLSAAHFYRKEKPNARILILDNHDDFGGHAKRNEFEVDGKTLIMHGGSESMVAPSGYPQIVKTLLDDLGVDVSKFETAYDQDFYARHGLRTGLHFNKEAWGVDRIVPISLGYWEGFVSPAGSDIAVEEAVSAIPITEAAQAEFLRFLTTEEDQIPDIPVDEKVAYLSGTSYRDFLSKHLEITEPEVFVLLQDLMGETGVGPEAVSAYTAIMYAGLPGRKAAGLPEDEADAHAEPYIHHFPDGNASIARLLVRKMIPDVAPGNTMEDIVTARFDYSKLDLADNAVRLRLNSTVTRVKHEGTPTSADTVRITYVRDGQAHQVRARGCVLACYNAIIPYLCPELPEPQREALAGQVKQPILITNVALRNWRPWKELGICSVQAPGSYHNGICLNYPVSIGEYSYAMTPDEPVTALMTKFPHVSNQGLNQKETFRVGRLELLTTPFEDIERNVRIQLASMLGEGGFDPAADILGITVNRWAHGYSYFYNSLFDTTYGAVESFYAGFNDDRYPHVRARQPFGRISIANSDSAATAMLEAAVEQGHRAVTELPM